MSDNLISQKKILLIGAGNMGIEYAKVLQALGASFSTVGRGRESCDIFFQKTGLQAIDGGVESHLRNATSYYDAAIVASDSKYLYDHTELCIRSGIRTFLVEKPGGLDTSDIRKLKSISDSNSSIFIAYNRRFYSSVLTAKRIIEEDGGIRSCSFDFTEWPHTVEKLDLPDLEKRNWVLRNSSHVLDLVFHLCGNPVELNSESFSGNISWTPKSIFVGFGITDKKIPFSYHANWESPGRWWIEFNTNFRKLIFKPLEQLQMQEHGSIKVEPVSLEDAYDRNYKPGLFLQVRNWIEDKTESLCGIDEHFGRVGSVYSKIAGFEF